MTGKKELRLALGMRGGVSLAIWIGGACAEIDRLRKANAKDDKDFWRKVLDESDYDAVIVDVIAGASAGGLNGVLYAASQQYGFDLDEVRQTWLQVAGLAEMTRSETPDLSVLDGDRKFLDVLDAELARLVKKGTPPSDRPRLDVQLSATLVTPITRPAPGEDDKPSEVRYMSRFHFAHEPRSCEWASTDFPADDTDSVVAKLALAGRATSSFPAAFEPSVVRSSRPATYTDAQATTSRKRYVDMRGVFADARGAARTENSLTNDDFIVADGGILDNIPLGKALTAVAHATASRPTKRYLVYLHPTGPGEEPDQPEALGGPAPSAGAVEYARRSALGVLTGAFGSRMQAETTLGDIEQLEALNRDGRLAGRIREASLGPVLTGEKSIVELAGSTLRRYELERSLGDARAVGALLKDPLGVLGTDVFPASIAGADGADQIPDDRWRSPVARWTPERREAIEAGLLDSFAQRLPGSTGSTAGIQEVFEAGTGPLDRLLRLMIEWARHLDRPENATGSPDGPGVLRQRLYDVATFVREELGSSRDLAWVTCAAGDRTGESWATPPLERVDSLLHVDTELVGDVCEELAGRGGADARTELVAVTRTRLHELLISDPATALAGTVDIRTAIVDEILVPIAQQLVGMDGPSDSSPGSLLHDALASAAGDLRAGGLTARQVLAALEVLCYQEFLTGSPGGAIDFVRMSAANRTPLNNEFKSLVELGENGEPRPLTAARKLAGNELMNFAAFAKADWRANDWMWGRLDAAATLVDLLVTPDSIARIVGSAAGGPDLGLANIKAMVCDDAASDEWKEHFENDVWASRESAITSALAAFCQDPSDNEHRRALAGAIGDAVLARRHWEILSDELGKAPWSESRAPLGPEATIEAVQKHSVGLDTFRTAPVTAHVAMFKGLSDAAGRAVTQTVHTRLSPGKADEKAGGVARWSGRVVRYSGRVATEALLRPKRLIAETAIGGVLFVGAIVLLIIA